MTSHDRFESNTAAQQIYEIAIDLLSKQTFSVVGVCGLGGIGKSTACRLVDSKLKNQTCLVETDWFLEHASQERRMLINTAITSGTEEEIAGWKDPSSWYNWDAIVSALRSLRNERSLSVSEAWNQETGYKDLGVSLSLSMDGNALVICDGIYLLHPEISKEFDSLIMLTGDVDRTLSQGATRDSHRSPNDYLEFKASLTQDFDVPYFQRFEDQADKIITVC